MENFEAGPRTMVRTFPFADLWQFSGDLAVGIDSPKPFAMNAIDEVLLDVVPDPAASLEELHFTAKLEGIKKAGDGFGLRPAFLAWIKNRAGFALVAKAAVNIETFLQGNTRHAQGGLFDLDAQGLVT